MTRGAGAELGVPGGGRQAVRGLLPGGSYQHRAASPRGTIQALPRGAIQPLPGGAMQPLLGGAMQPFPGGAMQNIAIRKYIADFRRMQH